MISKGIMVEVMADGRTVLCDCSESLHLTTLAQTGALSVYGHPIGLQIDDHTIAIRFVAIVEDHEYDPEFEA